jgi:hypothetical protein
MSSQQVLDHILNCINDHDHLYENNHILTKCVFKYIGNNTWCCKMLCVNGIHHEYIFSRIGLLLYANICQLSFDDQPDACN